MGCRRHSLQIYFTDSRLRSFVRSTNAATLFLTNVRSDDDNAIFVFSGLLGGTQPFHFVPQSFHIFSQQGPSNDSGKDYEYSAFRHSDVLLSFMRPSGLHPCSLGISVVFSGYCVIK
jgi:hypothetical protein